MTAPDLAVKVPGRGRLYKHPVTGEHYPSITNIIDVLEKPWLGRWAAKFVAGEAWDKRFALARIDDREAGVDMLKGAPWRKRDKAADLGSNVHEIAEALTKGEELPAIEPEAEPFLLALRGFIEEFQPSFRILEGTVFSDTHTYAGTFDFLAFIGDLLLLGDYKTSASGIFDEVALQLAANANAEAVWDPRAGELHPMPKVQGCIAVHLQPGKFAVHRIDAGPEAFEAFLGLRQAWPWNKEHGGAVGPRMQTLARLVKEFSPAADGQVATTGEGQATSTLEDRGVPVEARTAPSSAGDVDG